MWIYTFSSGELDSSNSRPSPKHTHSVQSSSFRNLNKRAFTSFAHQRDPNQLHRRGNGDRPHPRHRPRAVRSIKPSARLMGASRKTNPEPRYTYTYGKLRECILRLFITANSVRPTHRRTVRRFFSGHFDGRFHFSSEETAIHASAEVHNTFRSEDIITGVEVGYEPPATVPSQLQSQFH